MVARINDSAAAGKEAGWSSHLMKSRTSAPWSRDVWIQSIHGRRCAASTGPVAPITTMGTRSHHALKMPIDACINPTLLWTTTPMGLPVTLA